MNGKRITQAEAMYVDCVYDQGTMKTIAKNLLAAVGLTVAMVAPAPAAPQRDVAGMVGFEANRGQLDPGVRFAARGSQHTVSIVDGGARIGLAGAIDGAGSPGLTMQVVGADAAGRRIDGRRELPGKVNYFLGPDPACWREDVPTYAEVVERDVYPGVDLVYHRRYGDLEFDFVLAPGADPARLRLAFPDARRIALDRRGDLLVHPRTGDPLRLHRPLAWQDGARGRDAVAVSFRLGQGGAVGFHLGPYDRDRALVVDPVLSYSTYLGGSGEEDGRELGRDGHGNLYLVGSMTAPGFPGNSEVTNAFVAKLDPTGTTLLYVSYLGGSGTDLGGAMHVTAEGEVWVAGWTDSPDFPVPSGLQVVPGGGNDAFLARLDASGTVVYATLLGWEGDETGTRLDVDEEGYVYLAGITTSTGRGADGETGSDHPIATAQAFQQFNAGGVDTFVAKLSPGGDWLEYLTFLGGADLDHVVAVRADRGGRAHVAGFTRSRDFPLRDATQPVNHGGGPNDGDAFVAKLSADGADLMWSTFLGGSDDDVAHALALDPEGRLHVAGYTASYDFPIAAGAFQDRLSGRSDGFYVRFTPSGALDRSTYIGGSRVDGAYGIALDHEAKQVYLTGATSSRDFPMVKPIQAVNGGLFDAFVAVLDAAGTSLVQSTYFGGSGGERAEDILVDPAGGFHIVGATTSGDLPLLRPLQPVPGGGSDVFIAGQGGLCTLHRPVGPLFAVRAQVDGLQRADLRLEWQPAGAAEGYNVWRTHDKGSIPEAQAPGSITGVEPVAGCNPTAYARCVIAGGAAGPAGEVSFFQVRGLCGGFEGP